MSPVVAAPSVSAAAGRQVALAQRGGGLAGSVSAGVRASLRRVWTPCQFSRPSLGERNVLTAPALGKVRRRPGTAAAAHRPGGPAAAPPVVLMELALSCAALAVAGGRPWWSVGH
jgi:hypothetical protein